MPTNIGQLFRTQIPDLTEIADIQEAFRIYHYGVKSGTTVPGISYNTENTATTSLEPQSIAGYLQNLSNRIDGFNSGITSNSFTDKGYLLSAKGPGELFAFAPGAPGQVLTVNPFTDPGLEWRDIGVTLDNTVTLTNKTLEAGSVTASGLKFLGNVGNAFSITLAATNPNENRTIFLPNISTTLVGTSSVDIFTNKTVSLETNTVLGTVAQFNTALTNADFLTTLNTVTIAQGGTGGTTALTAKTNLDIFRNTSSAAYGAKIYVANPATVGENGSGIVGAATGDLWFW
jgi:hypothetical protein